MDDFKNRPEVRQRFAPADRGIYIGLKRSQRGGPIIPWMQRLKSLTAIFRIGSRSDVQRTDKPLRPSSKVFGGAPNHDASG